MRALRVLQEEVVMPQVAHLVKNVRKQKVASASQALKNPVSELQVLALNHQDLLTADQAVTNLALILNVHVTISQDLTSHVLTDQVQEDRVRKNLPSTSHVFRTVTEILAVLNPVRIDQEVNLLQEKGQKEEVLISRASVSRVLLIVTEIFANLSHEVNLLQEKDLKEEVLISQASISRVLKDLVLTDLHLTSHVLQIVTEIPANLNHGVNLHQEKDLKEEVLISQASISRVLKDLVLTDLHSTEHVHLTKLHVNLDLVRTDPVRIDQEVNLRQEKVEVSISRVLIEEAMLRVLSNLEKIALHMADTKSQILKKKAILKR